MSDYITDQIPYTLTESYHIMETLPDRIAMIISVYVEQISNEEQRHEKAMQVLSNTFEAGKEALSNARSEALAKAEADRKVIMDQMISLKGRMQAAKMDYDSAVDSLTGDKKISPAIGRGLAHVLGQVKAKESAGSREFEETYARIVRQEDQICQDKTNAAEDTYNKQMGELSGRYSDGMDRENAKYTANRESIYNTARAEVEKLDPNTVRNLYDMLLINVPQSDNYEAVTEMPEAVQLGFLYSFIDEWEGEELYEPVINLIRDSFSFALHNVRGRSVLRLPYGNAFTDFRLSKFIQHDPGARTAALDYLRAIEMRLFMSIPCGKLRVTMMDPVDSGSNFSMFSSLGDDDERIISTRIWCDPKRIKEQLGLLIAQIEHVNQDCLRNDFDNIVDYNRHVGKNAEPLQALFVADFPRHFDKESCEMLEKIVSSGPRCGIYSFISGAIEDIDNCEYDIKVIPGNMEEMEYLTGALRYQYGSREYVVEPAALPEREKQPEIFKVLINGIKTSDRIIIYFDEIADQLTHHPEKWFKFDDSNGIDVPIGLEGASRTVQIHLGGELITQHHALISGTIGSGKSTLLHTIIMSILLRYSPEDVQIYLLDFKRGVEFKVYAESKLCNFRVISLDTEPEFGLAVLSHLEEEQADRAQEFHDKGCENIEKYNELAEADPYNRISKIPRIVLIIDEFHEMFLGKGSEDNIAKECERLLEQIVRQGRALGIHVILASQTLPDNLDKIYGQMMNRIALQSTAASAQRILDPDNEALASLVNVDPGKGVFNDGGGNRDANHPFRVAYFESDEQRELLGRISGQQEQYIEDGLLDDTEIEKPRLLLSSIQDDYENPLNRFVVSGTLPGRLDYGCPLYLGEEIAMINTFHVSLTSRRRQNLLILGSDFNRASLLYGFSAISILFNVYRRAADHVLPGRPVITFFDFGSTNRRSRKRMDIMNELCARFPDLIRVFSRETLMDGLEILQKEYKSRTDSDENHYVIFAGLNRARRLLDTDSAYAMPPKTMFINLVKNGPERGVNYIIWANEPSTFCSLYSELIPEFDNRLVYNLKEEEYELVVKSSAMTTEFDNNVISYNPDDDNKKVRIYAMPLAEWLTGFMDRLEEPPVEEAADPVRETGAEETAGRRKGDVDIPFDEEWDDGEFDDEDPDAEEWDDGEFDDEDPDAEEWGGGEFDDEL